MSAKIKVLIVIVVIVVIAFLLFIALGLAVIFEPPGTTTPSAATTPPTTTIATPRAAEEGYLSHATPSLSRSNLGGWQAWSRPMLPKGEWRVASDQWPVNFTDQN